MFLQGTSQLSPSTRWDRRELCRRRPRPVLPLSTRGLESTSRESLISTGTRSIVWHRGSVILKIGAPRYREHPCAEQSGQPLEGRPGGSAPPDRRANTTR